ncbi:MAG: tagatose 1,6-diphosphate aldolase [Rhodospirillales bacterium]|nr:tagatose 1,6-diphosphate aldolase [Rhodospirillales bacterium]MDE2576741.1 tagatose 1,6-diphosphate aldolase [Rhodospirillales bacterium]
MTAITPGYSSPSRLTPGKSWGMRRLADASGRFRMLAIDQRPPIMDMIRTRTGAAPRFGQTAEVKRLLAETLAPSASAVLVDPVWGYDACAAHLRADRGLILTLEDHAFADGPGGRRSAWIEGWTPQRIRRAGGDAVKLLAWLRPDADPVVTAHQLAVVAATGEACRTEDIPFVCELLLYPFASTAGIGTDYASDPARRPEMVRESVAALVAPTYGVDLWKLESPLPPEHVPDPDGPEAAPVQALFDELGKTVRGPWVMLSGGADLARFLRVLTYAYRAGASGFLAGRTIWAAAFAGYPDLAAVRAALAGPSCAALDRLNELTERLARPWQTCP